MGSKGTRNKEQQEAQRLYEELKALEGPKSFHSLYLVKQAQLEAFKKANKAKLDEAPGVAGAPAPVVEVVKEKEPALPVELEEAPVVKVPKKAKAKDE